VDEDGTAKACSKERFALGKVLKLADRLALALAIPGRGELSRRLEKESLPTSARDHALHAEV